MCVVIFRRRGRFVKHCLCHVRSSGLVYTLCSTVAEPQTPLLDQLLLSCNVAVYSTLTELLHVLLPREAMLSAVYAVVVCLCVCLSVCHTPVLYQNG